MKVYKISTISLVLLGTFYGLALFGLIMLIYRGIVSGSWISLVVVIIVAMIFGWLVRDNLKRPIRITVIGDKIDFRSLISTMSINTQDISEIQSGTIGSSLVLGILANGLAPDIQVYCSDKNVVNIPHSIEHLDDFIREVKKINPAIKVSNKS